MRVCRWALGLVGCAILFYGIAGYLSTASLIGENARWRGINRLPESLGLKGDVVSLRSTDDISLKGWWLPSGASSVRANVIIAHGIDHTRQVMLPRAAFLVRGGYNVLTLDLRGQVRALRNTLRRDISNPVMSSVPSSTFATVVSTPHRSLWSILMVQPPL